MNDFSATDLATGARASAPPAVPDHSARNRRVIWLLLAAAFVVILNETIMGVALRELMLDLKILFMTLIHGLKHENAY